ncbi:hypothetical protein F5Y14DRAFT_443264 [Nemania sp. NC0429]|nr:hypothetical protein F5Y14DRAFT_443264 [Nemania sp. NC0429]
MADTPSSTQRTPRRLPDAPLNAALLDFAPRYMRDQLKRLARECDQRLERELLPRLHAILREIDHERDVFEAHKQEAARDLRDHLNLLRLDSVAAEDAIRQLQAVTPRYLTIIPSASSLTLPVPASDSLSARSMAATSDNAFASTFNTPEADTGSQDASLRTWTPETLDHGAQHSATPEKPPSLESQVQAQVIAESSVVPWSPKRPNADVRKEGEASAKRQRTANEHDDSEAAAPKIERRVAFPNLMTGECIFRHVRRKGFFVVRCDYCDPGFFTEPPLLYNRALKHFQKHREAISHGEELTNELIFEKFACQVDGEDMASKYWIKEHLGSTPHTFGPLGPSTDAPEADDSEDIGRRQEDIEEDISSPSRKLRESLRSRQSDGGDEHEKPRRTRRNVPRPDYAEMVAFKGLWSAPETEAEVSLCHRRRGRELMQALENSEDTQHSSVDRA